MIPSFANHLPIKIRFGEHIVQTLVDVLRAERCNHAFVAVDRGLEELVPSVAAALAALDPAGIQVTRYVKCPGEPTIDVVDSAAAALAASGADAVVAIGGGSVMDTAKAARLCAQVGKTFAEFLTGDRTIPAALLPLVCVPTTAGTGSEVSGGAVITDAATRDKSGIAGPYLRAQHALVDPAVTYSLPASVTAHTGIDALAQAIAAVVAKTRTPIGDAIALESVRLVSRSLVAAVRDGSDRDARSEMACASLLAGLAMNISDCAAEHSLGQALGGKFHLPHGLTIGLVLAETLERERHYVPELLERVADAMGEPEDWSGDGSRAVTAVRRLLAELDFPRLADVGVTEADLDELTDRAAADFFITQSPSPWSAAEVRAAFAAALALDSRRILANGSGNGSNSHA
jgi:alcohol dehydrogenase